jgi:hypothetical protein
MPQKPYTKKLGERKKMARMPQAQPRDRYSAENEGVPGAKWAVGTIRKKPGAGG